MGNANSKLYEEIIIGYIHDNNDELKRISPTIKLHHEKEENKENEKIDRVINQPQQYGFLFSQPCTLPSPPPPSSLFLPLAPYSSSSSSSTTSFFSSTNNSNNNTYITLSNDLDYIDSTYYYYSPFLHNNNTIQKDKLIIVSNQKEKEEQQQQKIITLKDLIIIDKLIRVISLSQYNLTSLSSNIGLLNSLRKLDLSNNKLISLPESIGYLQSLESLYLGHNQLNSLPATIGYLTQLIELDISHNQLTQITPCLYYLKQLQYLIMPSNQCKYLPVHLFLGLKRLTILDVSHNFINILPAEITQLQNLKRLFLEGNPILNDDDTLPPITRMKLPCYTLSHSPPSLKELCARLIVQQHHHHYDQSSSSSSLFSFLPTHLMDYLQSSTPCSLCQEPYFETFILRGRLIERNQKWIPIEYRLCKAHFTTEEDRVLAMFSISSPSSSSSSSFSSSLSPFMPYLPPLPILHSPKKENKKKNRYSIIEKKDPASIVESILQPLDTDSCFTSMANNNNNSNDHPLNTWRSSSHRKKVMNKNHSGFLSLTKL